jgi:hypothetical protein
MDMLTGRRGLINWFRIMKNDHEQPLVLLSG